MKIIECPANFIVNKIWSEHRITARSRTDGLLLLMQSLANAAMRYFLVLLRLRYVGESSTTWLSCLLLGRANETGLFWGLGKKWSNVLGLFSTSPYRCSVGDRVLFREVSGVLMMARLRRMATYIRRVIHNKVFSNMVHQNPTLYLNNILNWGEPLTLENGHLVQLNYSPKSGKGMLYSMTKDEEEGEGS